MKRQTFLTGGAAAATSLAMGSDFSHEARAADKPLTAKEVEGVAAQLRARVAQCFDPAYVENAILPFFLVSVYRGERATLPIIDVSLTKGKPPPHLSMGADQHEWRPAPDEGVTAFLQGLKNAGRTIVASASI